MIGKLFAAGVLAAGLGYVYPLWNEHAASTCQAVEKRFLTPAEADVHPARLLSLAVARVYLEPLSHGRVAETQAKGRYPALPADLGCAVAYWRGLLDLPPR
ncbi:MAG TPA: hypothetical protein VJ779_09500 [Acetobacteraceae bacterium]|nr:hypothetical protein [Acetobacteraceae bacterium]